MKLFSIVMLCLLTSCNSFCAHKDDLKPMGRDMADEGIDSFAAEIESQKKTDSISTQ
jgi:hypothetical protein